VGIIKAATDIKVIVNPVAGANSTHRKWPYISRLLRHIGLSFDHQHTEGVGHGIELAREAVSKGYSSLVAVGGDGTINEVANGIITANGENRASLGVVNTGTGSDFVRMLGLPRDYASGCRCLMSPQRRLIDVGIVQCLKDRQMVDRAFVNAAGLGFDAEAAKDKQQRRPLFRGTVPYILSLLRTLSGYQNKLVTIDVDGRTEEQRVLSVVVANGRFFGGGMKVAPEADLGDNMLDVITVGDFGKLELLWVFPRIYRGTHISYSKVRMEKASRIRVSSEEPFLVHADGEVIGEGPARFLSRSHALSVII
jgi:YegS/Rv2252/BmrU family lipid kinase